jgi:hypothetical protein
MRRPVFLATFVLTAALSVGWAQRSGMRGGGGPAHSGFGSRGTMVHSAPARFGHGPSRGGQFAGGFHGPNRGPNRFHPRPVSNRGHHHGFNFVPGLNLRHRSPLYYGGYYSPWYWDWYGSSYDSYDSSQNDYAQTQMLRQIDDLSQEVQRLRQEQEYSEQTAGSVPPASAPAPQPSAEPAKIDTGLPVVLVFFDKKIQEVKNYAVMNEMLVVFDGSRTTKIPLRDLDLAATMKLNDERGVDFQIPN